MAETFRDALRFTFLVNLLKSALRLVNSASTICPWVYAADVCANVYKAKILTDVVSKAMADVPSARNEELSSQLSEDDTESPLKRK